MDLIVSVPDHCLSFYLAFLDDILILGQNFEDHLKNVKEALEKFRKYKLKLKPKKCIFFQKKVEFLGRMISQDTMEMSSGDCVGMACAKELERRRALSRPGKLS